jgi:hypothetical protein
LKKFKPRDVTRFRLPYSEYANAAIPELKNKSTARPRNTVENSFNSAVANKDRRHAGKYALKPKSTSTIELRRSDQHRTNSNKLAYQEVRFARLITNRQPLRF